MAQDVNVQQKVFQKTLEEVSRDADHPENANPCVICLDQVEEEGIALPCQHASFDFICLVSWLGERAVCPLCQGNVTAVKYDVGSLQGAKIYSVPQPVGGQLSSRAQGVDSLGSTAAAERYQNMLSRGRPRRSAVRRRSLSLARRQADDPLARRRHVYRNQLYSRRVGTNRLSQYREITPQTFSNDENLVSRARKWIRRELQVFLFLNPSDGDEPDYVHQDAPDSNSISGRGGQTVQRRRANNAEFLLEYIVAILRTVDIKGSGGQAEELLREFIGRDNARLFLHELQAWLRSPYNSLEDWDRAVQYDEGTGTILSSRQTSESLRASSGQSNSGGGQRGSSQPRGIRKFRAQQRPRRRIQSARQRYLPD